MVRAGGGRGDLTEWPEAKLPREATEEEMRGLATPEKLAQVVGPPLALLVQRIGYLPAVETTAKVTAEAVARHAYLQEIGQDRVDSGDALELAASMMLVVHDAVEEEV